MDFDSIKKGGRRSRKEEDSCRTAPSPGQEWQCSSCLHCIDQPQGRDTVMARQAQGTGGLGEVAQLQWFLKLGCTWREVCWRGTARNQSCNLIGLFHCCGHLCFCQKTKPKRECELCQLQSSGQNKTWINQNLKKQNYITLLHSFMHLNV